MDDPPSQSSRDDVPLKRRCAVPGSVIAKQESSTSTSPPLASSLSHGWISIMGRSRVMQEVLAVARVIGPDQYDFFGVHDGRPGAARWFNRMHELLSEEMKARRVLEVDVCYREEHWREAMEACFERMDDEVRGRGRVEELKAVVMVVGNEEIVVASRGDSTAVLYRGDVALGLSSHSRSELHGPDEKSPSKPSVRITDRRDEDRFVLVASNCLWDALSDDAACRIVRRCLDNERGGEGASESLGATKAAMVLVELAIARGSKDNISVLVVQLA